MEIGQIYLFVFSASLTTRLLVETKAQAKETLYLTKTTILYLLNNYFRKKGKQ